MAEGAGHCVASGQGPRTCRKYSKGPTEELSMDEITSTHDPCQPCPEFSVFPPKGLRSRWDLRGYFLPHCQLQRKRLPADRMNGLFFYPVWRTGLKSMSKSQIKQNMRAFYCHMTDEDNSLGLGNLFKVMSLMISGEGIWMKDAWVSLGFFSCFYLLLIIFSIIHNKYFF